MRINEISIFFGIVATLLFLVFVTSGPAALETQRIADHCSALHGFNTDEALSCMRVDNERVVLASGSSHR